LIELAEIFRRYGEQYREKFGQRLTAPQRAAMTAIEQCRTEALGGHLYVCDECEETRYSYHSCKNRHCPKCQHDAAQQWLAQQQALLLLVSYFMVTFTLPPELTALARSQPVLIYNLLFQASAAALQQLAADPRFVGGQIGMVGVLQTWTRDLLYHPHVHYLVPGGGLAPDRQSWLRARNAFLVHVKPLSVLFRAKFREALQKTELFSLVPAHTWSKVWVVHCQPVGSGVAALKYLAPYIFRVALSNSRIIKVENDQVTFRYKASDTGKTKYCTLSAEAFIGRFLQHVLPKGFMKVRYYGLFSPAQRHLLDQARQLLGATDWGQPSEAEPTEATAPDRSWRCPTCGQLMRLQETIKPKPRQPP
jgi:hypothetical protein